MGTGQPVRIVKESISRCLPSTGDIVAGSEIWISRKWYDDGGMAIIELVHPEFKGPTRLSIAWIASEGGKIYLVANEVDRTIDPPFLSQFLIELLNPDAVRTLDDNEFSAVLPNIKKTVDGTVALKSAEWRQQYSNNVTRHLNFI